MKLTEKQFNQFLEDVKSSNTYIPTEQDDNYATTFLSDYDILIKSKLGHDNEVCLRCDIHAREYRTRTIPLSSWFDAPELMCGNAEFDINIKEVYAFDNDLVDVTETEIERLKKALENHLILE